MLNVENSRKHYDGKLAELGQEIAQAEADREVNLQEVEDWTNEVVSVLPSSCSFIGAA